MLQRIRDMASGLLEGTAMATSTEINKLRDDLRTAGNRMGTAANNAVGNTTTTR
jgi:hypothetical protein